MYAEDELVPIAGLADITFCPRRAALHRIENIWRESVATAEGHLLHQRVHDATTESRGGTRIVRGLRLRSLRLGLTGIADVVEFRRLSETERGATIPGVKGEWQPFPVEYKRGVQRHELSFEVQLCAQALCLEEMLGCRIPAGALFYGLSRRRHDVAFDSVLRAEAENAALRLHALLDSGETPAATFEKKCKRCSLLDLCMPQTAGRGKSVGEYLLSEISDLKSGGPS